MYTNYVTLLQAKGYDYRNRRTCCLKLVPITLPVELFEKEYKLLFSRIKKDYPTTIGLDFAFNQN